MIEDLECNGDCELANPSVLIWAHPACPKHCAYICTECGAKPWYDDELILLKRDKNLCTRCLDDWVTDWLEGHS